MSFRPPVVILKEGTDTSQGVGQLISNINACSAVTSILKTTLGPRGMDKLIDTGKGVTITNDGATIINLLDIVHPAASTLVDIAKSQDEEVGDGTTSVCLLAGAFLDSVKGFIQDGVHPRVIINGFNMAEKKAQDVLREVAVDVDSKEDSKRERLLRCASTAMNSKLISTQKNKFSEMVVDAIQSLDKDLNLAMVGLKKVSGGSVTDSQLVDGVAFKKTFSYAGFEQQPKSFKNPKIALLNVELELKAERTNAEVKIDDIAKFQDVVDAEWDMIFARLKQIEDTGAKIVLSKLPIGDLATQYFADRGIFCAGRVGFGDLKRTAQATGGKIQTSLNDLGDDVLGECGRFEEKQIGKERFNLFQDCKNSKTVTFILRGGSEQYLEETERSLHDALMVVKRAVKHNTVVAGAGAVEMLISSRLNKYAKTIKTKEQFIIAAYAKALEVIPRQLAENAGFDSTDIINALRAKHATGNKWFGVDIENEGVKDCFKAFIWEPVLIRQNALSSATQAACLILSVDETIRNAKSHNPVEDGRAYRG